jgi:Flp pilus assembly protein TadB
MAEAEERNKERRDGLAGGTQEIGEGSRRIVGWFFVVVVIALMVIAAFSYLGFALAVVVTIVIVVGAVWLYRQFRSYG